jgi:hypothetical protein
VSRREYDVLSAVSADSLGLDDLAMRFAA